MGLLFLLLVVIATIAALYWHRTKSVPRAASQTHQARRKSNPFHAVTVKFRKDACNAVRELKAKRFLASEAPRLPLPKCTAKNCSCRFVHYDDRRGDERRDEIPRPQSDKAQRRSQQNRRRS
jgi:hypothetical protein